jgi:XTP/dITP diphosphohydrolase
VLVYVATTNPGKLRELRAIFAPHGWRLENFAGYREPEEGETSYLENAALKARALAGQLRAAGLTAAALGDDSGLEVRALGGRPGVLSARYGGAGATWAERRRSLVHELDATGGADRGAAFVCALHLVDVDGAEFAVEARLAGALARQERGEAGFSYDPIFEYADGRTFAQLSEDEKNAVSHRAIAAHALLERSRPAASGSTASSGM